VKSPARAATGSIAVVISMRVLRDDESTEPLLAELRLFVLAAFEGRFSEQDWEHTEGGWRIVVFAGTTPVAHGAVVPRTLQVGDREFRAGYVEGVATHPRWQRQGMGSRLMDQVTSVVRDEYELGGLSTGSPAFYERFGWERWRGESYVRDGDELTRTADEDDGLMVLRLGPSTGVDLRAPITCRARGGDDW
jgi:aminoglycoside 2'-N-acetyltransferase I